MGILSLIPTKGFVIIALLLGFGWYTLHERNLGAAKIEAADARLVAEAEAANTALQAVAQTASTTIGQVYEKAVVVPPVADLGVVCHAPSRRAVPQATQGGSGTPSPAPVVGTGPAFDPSGAALTVGRDDDALILALQDEIKVLLTEMQGHQ